MPKVKRITHDTTVLTRDQWLQTLREYIQDILDHYDEDAVPVSRGQWFYDFANWLLFVKEME